MGGRQTRTVTTLTKRVVGVANTHRDTNLCIPSNLFYPGDTERPAYTSAMHRWIALSDERPFLLPYVVSSTSGLPQNPTASFQTNVNPFYAVTPTELPQNTSVTSQTNVNSSTPSLNDHVASPLFLIIFLSTLIPITSLFSIYQDTLLTCITGSDIHLLYFLHCSPTQPYNSLSPLSLTSHPYPRVFIEPPPQRREMRYSMTS